MKKILKRVLLVVLIIVAVLLVAAGILYYRFTRPAHQDGTATRDAIATVEQGQLQGLENNGIYAFLGVPYASVEKRFVPASDPKPWTGVRDATSYGKISPQGAMFGIGGSGGNDNTDNACQNLNIWTPALGDGGKRPVMVWLHGGGFSTGSANDDNYNGEDLARDGDVVVVSVNHRLNVFGFLDLSAYGDEYRYSGNAGLTDIAASLKWIHENIAAFGGDPDNITLFGQSGGGAKVLALMSSPYTNTLFQKGIVESGATETMGVSFASKEVSQALTQHILENLGISAQPAKENADAESDAVEDNSTKSDAVIGNPTENDAAIGNTTEIDAAGNRPTGNDSLEQLQTVPVSDLESAASKALQTTAEEFHLPAALGGGYGMEWGPVVDGDYLPTSPVIEDSSSSGASSNTSSGQIFSTEASSNSDFSDKTLTAPNPSDQIFSGENSTNSDSSSEALTDLNLSVETSSGQNSSAETFAAAARDIPLLIGSNIVEWAGFVPSLRYTNPTQEQKDAFAKAYPDKDPDTLEQLDTLLRLPILKITAHKADQNGAPVYSYVFTQKGSSHGAEIPYVFDHQSGTLNDTIVDAWVSFARDGVPSSDNIPTWEPYTRDGGATMLLDDTSTLVHHHDENLLHLLVPNYTW